MHKTLFIVAAGLSTRFNGKPKHLAKIKGVPSIEHTLRMARTWYNSIYVVLNEKATEETIEDTRAIASMYGARQILIPSGKGDADAVFQSLAKSGNGDSCVSVCWGDAWFKSANVFKTASQALEEKDYSSIVFDAMCAMEESPYGWFTIDSDGTILKAEFASDYGVESPADGAYAAHDQCFFNINVQNFKEEFDQYSGFVDAEVASIEHFIEKCTSTVKLSLKHEISWYKMINWANKMKSSLKSTATVLAEPAALSFNTEEDLEKIRDA